MSTCIHDHSNLFFPHLSKIKIIHGKFKLSEIPIILVADDIRT